VRAIGGEGALVEVAELRAERELAGALDTQAELALEALGAGRRQLGHRRARLVEHRLGRRDRHEIGFGEVAVVVRLLLRAQRADRAGCRIEVERLLHDLLARVEDRPLALDLGGDTAFEKRNEFMFFSSVLVPSCSLRPAAATRWHRRAASPRPCSRR